MDVSNQTPWIKIGIGVGIGAGLGLLGILLLGKRGDLKGPSMLTMIAAESRTPEEFARRAEAWASTQARPPGDQTLVRAYPTRTPKLMRMIHEARKQREGASRERFQSLIAQPEDDGDLDGVGAIKLRQWDSTTQTMKATPATPKQKARQLMLHNLERVYYWRENDEYADELTERESTAVDEQLSNLGIRITKLLGGRPYGDLGDAKLDKKIARQSLKEERKAIHDYGKRRTQAKSKALKNALRHIRKEERQHAEMLDPFA